MRPLCDACESAAARVFCAADEAALCPSCDEKVHGCNKLASRHVRLALAEASAVRRCDICENAPAFFYCGIDGTSLCLHCDMTVHVGGKRTHERYLLMGQRVELPSCKKVEGLSGNLPKAEVTCLEGVGGPCNLERNGLNLELCKSPHNKSESSNTSAMAVAIGNTSVTIDLNTRPLREHTGTSQSVKDGVIVNGKVEEDHT